MSNFGLHKNETFFEHNFKHINLYLDLYKSNKNILFSIPLYSSIVSKILSVSLIYNKLETNSSICNNLSLNFYSFISNKTNNYLDLRFFDGYTYRFYKNVDIYECNELDASVAINGLTATLTIPGYKKLTYDQNGTNYYLTKIEGYSEEVAFSSTKCLEKNKFIISFESLKDALYIFDQINIDININTDAIMSSAILTIIGSCVVYIIVNDSTGIGIADDWTLVFLIPLFFIFGGLNK